MTYRITGEPDSLEPVIDALAAHQLAMEPADPKAVVSALVKMRALVGRKGQGADSTEMQIAAYIDALSEFPGDIVLDAIAKWPKVSKWWPTFFELSEMIRPVYEARKARQDVLFRLAAGEGPEPARGGGLKRLGA